MAGVDAGDRLPCPSCGETVLQKAMIPVLGEDGTGIRYLCVPCARLLIVKTADGAARRAADAGAEAGDEADGGGLGLDAGGGGDGGSAAVVDPA